MDSMTSMPRFVKRQNATLSVRSPPQLTGAERRRNNGAGSGWLRIADPPLSRPLIRYGDPVSPRQE